MKDENGFSLVSAMVGFGLVALTMMVLADAAIVSAKMQRSSAMQIDFDSLTESLRLAVAQEGSCTPSLLGQNPLTELAMRDPLDATRLLAAPQLERLAGITVTSIRLGQAVTVPDRPGLMRAPLQIEARKDMRRAMGSPMLTRNIADVFFSTDTNGLIYRCYSTSSLETIAEANCKMLGGKWTGSADKQNGTVCIIKAS
ncbi:MAG TPA: hypothetical protein VM598_11980 [Bdellovibrionota bacterium]|nr:hypothetical protein [Bdellovibrionota bacterium]